jgi:leucyl/phenylalanyl-tRNA--protein transferase
MAAAREWPVDPGSTSFRFPPHESADQHGRVATGGQLDAATLVEAYRTGLFPMRQSTGEMTWWSPDPRGVLTLDGLRVSHSLRRTSRHVEIRVDTAFGQVVAACAEREPGEYEWITDEIQAAYGQLHELGWAHSVETWNTPPAGGQPELVGGLYGVAIGGLFGGESMFHRRPDASKVALVALVELLREGDHPEDRLIDVQWLTPHLASLGAFEIPRREYLERLKRAVALPPPPAFARPP